MPKYLSLHTMALSFLQNDIEMFEIANESYAVENAVDELKAIATGIIESNDSDGVANWLYNKFCALDE